MFSPFGSCFFKLKGEAAAVNSWLKWPSIVGIYGPFERPLFMNVSEKMRYHKKEKVNIFLPSIIVFFVVQGGEKETDLPDL